MMKFGLVFCFLSLVFCSDCSASRAPSIPIVTGVIASGAAINSGKEWVIKATTDPTIFYWYLPPSEKWVIEKHENQIEVCHQRGCFYLKLDHDGDLYTVEKKKKRYFTEHSVLRTMYNATMNYNP